MMLSDLACTLFVDSMAGDEDGAGGVECLGDMRQQGGGTLGDDGIRIEGASGATGGQGNGRGVRTVSSGSRARARRHTELLRGPLMETYGVALHTRVPGVGLICMVCKTPIVLSDKPRSHINKYHDVKCRGATEEEELMKEIADMRAQYIEKGGHVVTEAEFFKHDPARQPLEVFHIIQGYVCKCKGKVELSVNQFREGEGGCTGADSCKQRHSLQRLHTAPGHAFNGMIQVRYSHISTHCNASYRI